MQTVTIKSPMSATLTVGYLDFFGRVMCKIGNDLQHNPLLNSTLAAMVKLSDPNDPISSHSLSGHQVESDEEKNTREVMICSAANLVQLFGHIDSFLLCFRQIRDEIASANGIGFAPLDETAEFAADQLSRDISSDSETENL